MFERAFAALEGLGLRGFETSARLGERDSSDTGPGQFAHEALTTDHCAEHTMAISKAKKAEKVKGLAKELETSTTAIIGTFSKLTVAKDYQLRKVIREAGGKYRVVKNRLAAISGSGTQVEAALKGLRGVNSVAFTAGDPVALAKVFAKWAGENAAEFQFKLGIVDGKLLTIDDVKALATMPGKEEIFAKLLYLINAPAQRLATVINAAGRDLAVVLGQGVEKEKFAAEAAA
jgi:large subunit ribosomal protein L10